MQIITYNQVNISFVHPILPQSSYMRFQFELPLKKNSLFSILELAVCRFHSLSISHWFLIAAAIALVFRNYQMVEFDLNIAIDVESSSNAISSLGLISFFWISVFVFVFWNYMRGFWLVNFELFELVCIHCCVVVIWYFNAIVLELVILRFVVLHFGRMFDWWV